MSSDPHAGRLALAAVLGLALWSCSSCSSNGVSPDSRTSDSRAPVDVRFVFADLDPSRCTAAKPAPAANYEAPLQVSRGVKWQGRLADGWMSLSPPVTWPDGTSVLTTVWGGIQAASKDGELLWTLPPPTGLANRDGFSGYRAVGARELVLFGDGYVPEGGSAYGKVHAVSRDGKDKWTAALDGPFNELLQMVVGPFVASDGRVLVGGADSKLYFLEGSTGAITRRISMPSPITHLVIDEVGTSYAVVNHKVGRVAAVSKDGALLWAQQLGPVPTSTKSTAFAGVFGLALSPTGDLIASATAYEGDGNARTWVMAVDRGCGKMRWKLELQGGGGGGLVGVDGTVFGGVAEGGDPRTRTLLSVSPKGVLRWKKGLDTLSEYSEFRAIGPLGADGTLYAFVDAYDPVKKADVRLLQAYSQSGELLWQDNLPVTNFDGSYATLRRDGVLIFPGEIKDGVHGSIHLTGYQTQSPGLARSGWPRFYHDNLSTSDCSTPLE